MTLDPSAAPLHVDERGEGVPALLLHSGGMSSRQWKALAERLAASHRAIAPDFLGSGKNAAWPADAPFHFDMDVDAVARLLGDLPVPAHVVGHSYGGLIAMTLARRMPERVRSVVVYDPVAFGVLHDPPDVEALADLAQGDSTLVTDEARGGGPEWMEAFVDYWNGPGAWRALPESSRGQFLRVGRKVFREVVSLLADRTPARAYAVVTSPVLILTGERSPLAARRVGETLVRALPRGRLEIVPGAGHMGPLTHAETVIGRVVRHIEEC